MRATGGGIRPAYQAFAGWLLSSEGQGVIAEFGKAEYGRSLFVPAASLGEEGLLTN